MKWRALATDYDGTFAVEGTVDEAGYEALKRLRENGVKALLVTGREMRDFEAMHTDLSPFEIVVAENGALLYFPKTSEYWMLAGAPPAGFVEELRKRGVGPISVGRSIVATWEPHEHTVLEVIKELGLELQVIFNKGAVMILPTGINKASGLKAALKALQIAPADVVAVGDAENDHAFLEVCGLSVAVGNALPALKARAKVVTMGERTEGVIELIDRMLLGHFDSFPHPVAA